MLNVCCEMYSIDLPILVRVSKPCFRAMMERNDTVPSSNLEAMVGKGDHNRSCFYKSEIRCGKGSSLQFARFYHT